ncbi:MAG TPA: metallopeptidase family protein [Thermoleophilaceae bacterium]|nr:metallopeptidase family protein [Thermoleophilaceae bacterium]
MRETLLPVLRAAALTAFLLGTAALLLNPPSLAGAEDLLTLVLGAGALVLLTAWATVGLMGRDGMSDREFEQLVRRSEQLARESEPIAEPSEFDLLVGEAIDRLPGEFRELLDDTPVVISHHGREVRAYGHYFGDTVARDNWHDRIVIYQDTLERDYGHDPEQLAAQVERTLRHELAHHLGWNERGVEGLGL